MFYHCEKTCLTLKIISFVCSKSFVSHQSTFFRWVAIFIQKKKDFHIFFKKNQFFLTLNTSVRSLSVMEKGEKTSKRMHQRDEDDENLQNRRQRLESPSSAVQVVERTTKLTDLNDDCLEKIFGHLDLRGLLNVSIANQKVRAAAGYVYRRKFGAKSVIIEYFPDLMLRNPCLLLESSATIVLCVRYYFETCLQFLRCLGSSISHITIIYGLSESKRFQYIHHHINKYCYESLTGISFDQKLNIPIEHFDKPFLNVQFVSISNCNLGEQLPKFGEWFPNSQRLCLKLVSLDRNYIEVHFQNLKTLKIFVGLQCTFMRKMIFDILHPNREIENLSIGLAVGHQLKMKPLLNVIKQNSSILELILEPSQYRSVVSALDVQRIVSEHPSMAVLRLHDYKFTAKNAIALIRQLNSLKQFRFQLDDLSEYEYFASQLMDMDSDWELRICDDFIELNRKN